MLPYSSGHGLDLVVRVGDSDRWEWFQTVSAGMLRVSGYVMDGNGTAVFDVSVNLGNQTWGTGTGTDENGYYVMYVDPGIYHFNIWVDQSQYPELSGYWDDGFAVSGDTVNNVTLMEPLDIRDMWLMPGSVAVNDTMIVRLNVTTQERFVYNETSGYSDLIPGEPKLGLPSSVFSAWVYDHSGPGNWTGGEDDYHDQIDVNVTEVGGGIYVFNLTIPNMLPYSSGNNLEMVVRVGDRDSWRGFQTVSADMLRVSGYVMDGNGTGVVNAGVNMGNQTWGTGTGTDENGYYIMYVSPESTTLISGSTIISIRTLVDTQKMVSQCIITLSTTLP